MKSKPWGRLQTPLQRHLIDGDRPLAAVHRRRVVVWRVHVGAVVGGDPDPFDGPAFPVGQVLDLRAGEERDHLGRGLLVVVVVDLRQVPGRIRGDTGLQLIQLLFVGVIHHLNGRVIELLELT